MALESVIASRGYEWKVRLVNLQEVLDKLDIFRKLTGIRLQDIYNLVLAKGWTLGSSYLLPCMHGVIRLYHPQQVKLLSEFWRQQRPDIVVSLIPNFNRALFQSLQNSRPNTPLVTILTDLADYPPHFWMERQHQYLVCGTERAVAQARAMGYRNGQVFQTSGMILRPDFYEPPTNNRRAQRQNLGLDPDLPTGLVLFGAEGSNAMFPIAERLGNSASNLQMIMICGRNAMLRERLSKLRTRNKIVLEGFTKEVPRYMRMSDFFVGKPGPGSISEALKMGLPVIVERNAWTLPQERYNAQWVSEQGLGVVLGSFRHIEKAVEDLLEPKKFSAMKERIAGMKNCAVFEIPPIIEKIASARE
ncbi:MAG: galactosyldiacylglycerol synthase [Acidobacteriota bacterium]|nr:galactosyldiacylglycerol synthase [Acidobacteriota bacterium]